MSEVMVGWRVVEVCDGSNEVLCRLLVDIVNGMVVEPVLKVVQQEQYEVVMGRVSEGGVDWDSFFQGMLYVLTKLSPEQSCEGPVAQVALEKLQRLVFGNLGCVRPALEPFVG